MKNKRTVITQGMCDHARILLAGGAKVEQAADIIGVGSSTIYRMKKAGFSADQYIANKEKEQVARTEAPAEELPGQMRMELKPVEETAEDQSKMMRFQAAMVDRLIVELDKFNDTLNMILRAMRKE